MSTDLAYQIIRRCPHLIYYVDEIGSTPLHLLAGKPAAFKSGSTLNWFDKIIYHCKTQTLNHAYIMNSPPKSSGPIIY